MARFKKVISKVLLEARVADCIVRGYDVAGMTWCTAGLRFQTGQIELYVGGSARLIIDPTDWKKCRGYVLSHVAREWVLYLGQHAAVVGAFDLDLVSKTENLQVLASTFHISREIEDLLLEDPKEGSGEGATNVLIDRKTIFDDLPPKNMLYFPPFPIQTKLRENFALSQELLRLGYLFELAIELNGSRSVCFFRPYNTPIIALGRLSGEVKRALEEIKAAYHAARSAG